MVLSMCVLLLLLMFQSYEQHVNVFNDVYLIGHLYFISMSNRLLLLFVFGERWYR